MKEITRIITCELTTIEKLKNDEKPFSKEVTEQLVKAAMDKVGFDDCYVVKIQDFVNDVEAEKHITRDEAVSTIYDVINSGLFNDDLEERLVDIARCIEAGKRPDPEDEYDTALGVEMFGADEDIDELFVAKLDPYTSSGEYSDEEKKAYDEWLDKQQRIYEKYKIK